MSVAGSQQGEVAVGSVAMELEHAVGFSGNNVNSLWAHGNGRDLVYAAGGCVVISDVSDPHSQVFLRGHDDCITSLAMSSSRRLIASGQAGHNADVVIWSFDERKLLHRIESHDTGIAALGFSHDDKLLASVGKTGDNRLFVWDVASGMMNAQAMPKGEIACVSWGGHEKDIKRRPTHRYIFATAGNRCVTLWILDPFTGAIESVNFSSGSHQRSYTCLQFSEDGEWLFAGSSSGDVTVFSVRSRMLQSCFPCAQGGVLSLVYLPPDPSDDSMSAQATLLVGGGDGGVMRLEGRGKAFRETPNGNAGFSGGVTSLASAPNDTVVVATDQAFVYYLHPSDMSVERVSENHARNVTSVAYPPDSCEIFATVSLDCSVRVWSLDNYRVLAKAIVRGAGAPTSISWGLESLITGWEDGRIRAFDGETGESLWTINDAHRGGVTALCVSHNMRFVVSGGAQGDVRVWDLKSRELVCHLKEHTLAVTRVALSTDDTHAVSCSKDRCILTWDLRYEKRVASHVQRMGALAGLDLHPDGERFTTVGQEKCLTAWSFAQSEPTNMLHNPHGNQEGKCVAVSSSGKFVATGGADQTVRLFDMESFQQVAEGAGHSGDVVDVKFSSDEKQLISVGADGCIFVWNIFQD